MQQLTKASIVFVVAILGSTSTAAHADEITDWNQMLLRAELATGSSPFMSIHHAAIVQAAVFDAVNGIDPRYTPLHVAPAAPAGASARAAAVQAAYATLVQLFPTQKALFDARRFVSLAALAAREDPAAIASGVAWGQSVAEQIIAWRSTDGTNVVLPPFLGGSGPGVWRPTPPGFAPGAAQAFATATPWVLTSPSQFRPAGFPPLTSAAYAADFNEVKLMGRATSTARSTDQTTLALFWASASSPVYLWDTVALSLLNRDDEEARDGVDRSDSSTRPDRSDGRRGHSLVSHARLLALVNIAMADAFIAIWDSKYFYVLWRPITAIALADTDGNPATTEDPTWLPLVVTPPYPSYASGLVGVSTAAATVLSAEFGEHTHFTMKSDLLLGVTRSFRSFSAAIDEAVDARVFAGIHYRFDDLDARTCGTSVASYILDHAVLRAHGQP
jgi:hypothetical protein